MKINPQKCPVALTSQVLGGKWKARIIWCLVHNKALRFNEIRKACPPISDRILSRELKDLVEWRLLNKVEFDVVPPKTEYSLSEFGETIKPVMFSMADWGLGHGKVLR